MRPITQACVPHAGRAGAFKDSPPSGGHACQPSSWRSARAAAAGSRLADWRPPSASESAQDSAKAGRTGRASAYPAVSSRHHFLGGNQSEAPERCWELSQGSRICCLLWREPAKESVQGVPNSIVMQFGIWGNNCWRDCPQSIIGAWGRAHGEQQPGAPEIWKLGQLIPAAPAPPASVLPPRHARTPRGRWARPGLSVRVSQWFVRAPNIGAQLGYTWGGGLLVGP